jgi:3-dehydroquinate synthase
MDLPYFDTQALTKLKDLISCYAGHNRNITILCDKNTKRHCLSKLIRWISFPFNYSVICISDGEKHKNMNTALYIWQKLSDENSDKNTILLCLGGGVVCDMGGFIAATFKRGIEHILIPTTLIAQTDAAIGGKTAVNLKNNKNQIGIFYAPKATFMFPEFLETLPEKEIFSGFAEMLKHGLIADENYWQKLIQITDSREMLHPALIERSMQIKTALCDVDPLDTNERKKLNFGHTIGHALESCFFSASHHLSHGEAVAWGMIVEAHIACQKEMITHDERTTIYRAISGYFPAFGLKKSHYSAVFHYLQQDKKRLGNNLNFTLLSSIGNAVINQQASHQQILNALTYITVDEWTSEQVDE